MTQSRFHNNLIAVFIVVLWVYLMLLLGGCVTTYEISKQMTDGSSVTVMVRSYREFQQPQVHYNRDGEAVTFDFGAEAATTAVSPIEAALADGIRAGAVVLNPIDQ